MGFSNKPHLLLFGLLVFTLYLSVASTLQFNQDGEFTLLQITDLHFCEEFSLDLKTYKLTKQMIKWVQPDFVMISGDGVSGYAKGSKTPGFFESCWKKFTAAVTEMGIPYGFTIGNHDVEADLTTEEIIKLDSSNPFNIRNQCEGIDGKGTFRIPIYSSRNPNNLSAHVWVFDSGSEGCEGVKNTWGCVSKDQIEWYDQESEKVLKQYGRDLQHIAFFHIPIPEYMNIINEERFFGGANEEVSCPVVNTGLFDHILKNGDITATFAGHDHNNDFGGWHKGVELVYGRKTGFGSYGDFHGARVIKFKEQFNQDQKIAVTRTHFAVYENGTIDKSDPIKTNLFKQGSCPPPKTENRVAHFFDSVFTKLNSFFNQL